CEIPFFGVYELICVILDKFSTAKIIEDEHFRYCNVSFNWRNGLLDVILFIRIYPPLLAYAWFV
ncbi:MAG: hypothetical protein RL511_295, partial [Bacteroidota bacterium]